MSYYKTGSEDYDLWKQQQLNEPSNDFSSPQNEKEAYYQQQQQPQQSTALGGNAADNQSNEEITIV